MSRLTVSRNCTDHLSIGPRGVLAQSTVLVNATCSDMMPGGLGTVQSGTALSGVANVTEPIPEISLLVFLLELSEMYSDCSAKAGRMSLVGIVVVAADARSLMVRSSGRSMGLLAGCPWGCLMSGRAHCR
jgi:hypothetical protein